MRTRSWRFLVTAAAVAGSFFGLIDHPLAAQEKLPAPANPTPDSPPPVCRLTLEEAKQRALANNKLLNLASLNADSKAFAVKAARADYFPKVAGSVFYLHFNDDLGTVLTAGGRTVVGPRGRALFTFPVTSISESVLNQDSSYVIVTAVQPLTDLLKVRQGVKIAQADEQIARAQLEGGIRKLVSGVEQLYWGILAVRRIRAGALQGVQGAELLAKTQTLEARTALVEARQGLQDADKQLADLQEQLNALLDLPACTTLELVEPPLPVLSFRCADEVIGLALAASPDVHEAQATISKAQAALAAGKLDYVPSIAVMGGYLNQTGQDYIQPNVGFVGAVASYTFVDWGKRRNVIRERQQLVNMANLKLQQTEDEVRQKAQKAFREAAETQEALKTAQEMAELRGEAVKKATPEAQRNPTALIAATKALGLAQVDAIKADLAYRQAYVQLMSLIGKQ
jgi:outer membrane protein TolC